MIRMKRRPGGRARPPLVLLALALLAPGAARAETLYKLQPILKQGDTVAGVRIQTDADFQIGALNDQGRLVFGVKARAGGEALLQYADGQFNLIATGGRNAPTGKWPGQIYFENPLSMNQAGDVVFSVQAEAPTFLRSFLGTFRWDVDEQKVTPVALTGMPGIGNETLVASFYPVINNHNDIAFMAHGDGDWSSYFLGRDRQLQAVAQSGQELPGGGTVQNARVTSINDAGMVAFVAHGSGDFRPVGAYVWEKGTITPVVKVGQPAPGGGVFVDVFVPQVNNHNRNVLLLASVADRQTNRGGPPTGLYLFTGSELRPVAVTGQGMPGGGKLQRFRMVGFGSERERLWNFYLDLSFSNEVGQTVFQARLDDGSTAVYLVDAEGQLSLVLKEGATTELGKITRLGSAISFFSLGLALNRHGQVAIPVQIDNGPATIVLLTPTAPPPIAQ